MQKKSTFIEQLSQDTVEILHSIYEGNVDLNAQNSKRQTLLMQACMAGNVPLVKTILASANKDEIDVNLQDTDGRTALMYACQNHMEEAVNILIKDFNADVNLCDYDDKSPLMYASESGACYTTLLENGADVHHQDKYKKTALHYAIPLAGNLDCVSELLKNGAEVNAVDIEGVSPLIVAAQKSQCTQDGNNVFDELLRHDADPNMADRNGTNVLMHAARSHNNIAINKLVEKKVNLDATDKFGNTAINYAISSFNLDGLERLLDLGAKSNIANINGTTPYIQIAQISHTSNSTILVDMASALANCSNADINKANRKGETPLIVCAKGDSLITPILLQRFIDLKANIEETDHLGNTALISAAEQQNSLSAMDVLLRNGANIDAQNYAHHSSLYWACHYTDKSKAFLILEHKPNLDEDSSVRNLIVNRANRGEDYTKSIIYQANPASFDKYIVKKQTLCACALQFVSNFFKTRK